MRSSMHVLGKYWLRCAALVGFKEGGKVLRVLSKEEEVSEWLIPDTSAMQFFPISLFSSSLSSHIFSLNRLIPRLNQNLIHSNIIRLLQPKHNGIRHINRIQNLRPTRLPKFLNRFRIRRHAQ